MKSQMLSIKNADRGARKTKKNGEQFPTKTRLNCLPAQVKSISRKFSFDVDARERYRDTFNAQIYQSLPSPLSLFSTLT